MAIKDSHFKAALNAKSSNSGSGLELPPELLPIAGGVFIVFLIVVFVVWKRMNRDVSAPDIWQPDTSKE